MWCNDIILKYVHQSNSLLGIPSQVGSIDYVYLCHKLVEEHQLLLPRPTSYIM